VKILFTEIAPAQKERRGGYTRIVKLGQRQGDAGQRAILEWGDMPLPEAEPASATPAQEAKPAQARASTQSEKNPFFASPLSNESGLFCLQALTSQGDENQSARGWRVSAYPLGGPQNNIDLL